ncbi:hypothetical protein LTR53_009408 [Teratosphaeriaceae sp. CCFEE 6253]|nr:hypothetical protein LTR53_009408 [Teratosphaeriaceae sp. CCFEE 6253]
MQSFTQRSKDYQLGIKSRARPNDPSPPVPGVEIPAFEQLTLQSSDTSPSDGAEVTPPRPHLLGLPREIRDIIYRYVETSVEVGNPDVLYTLYGKTWCTPSTHLLGVRLPALLRVCRLIHNEYLDTTKTKGLLDVYLGNSGLVTSIAVPWEILVPVEALRTIRHCEIDMHWSSILEPDNVRQTSEYRTWRQKLHAGKPQLVDWSPTRACGKLEGLLWTLGTLLHPSAKVLVSFQLMGLPDLDPPYWTVDIRARRPNDRRELATEQHAAFDMRMLLGMVQGRRAFPQLGKLAMEFIYLTPLYSTMAKNGPEVLAGLRAWERGEAGALVRPITERIAAKACWRMVPTSSENSYMGCWPEYTGCSDDF